MSTELNKVCSKCGHGFPDISVFFGAGSNVCKSCRSRYRKQRREELKAEAIQQAIYLKKYKRACKEMLDDLRDGSVTIDADHREKLLKILLFASDEYILLDSGLRLKFGDS